MSKATAKQAMKTDAEKKQELEQTVESGLNNPQVELSPAENSALPEGISISEILFKQNSDPLFKKYDFEIVYIPDIQQFAIKSHGKEVRIKETDLDIEEWNDKYQQNLASKFSKETKYTDINVYDYLQNEVAQKEEAQKKGDYRIARVMPAMAYSDNNIYIYHYDVPEDKIEECNQLMQKVYGINSETAARIIDYWRQTPDDAVARISEHEHELTHKEDDKLYDNSRYDLPPEYMAKLNMLTEIKANMVQAGFALDMYEATGNMKYFDKLSIYPEAMEELKTTLKENPNMDNKREYVAKFVYDKWLGTNNIADAEYSNQAFLAVNPQTHEYPLWAMADNQEAHDRYCERAMAMFENVFGIGDVRKVVNPDFKLNDDLQIMLECCNTIGNNETLRAIMAKDAQNANQCIENLKAYLEKIKTIDSDGIRTPEEIAQLDAYLKQVTNPQQEAPNMAATAAGRQRRDQGR